MSVARTYRLDEELVGRLEERAGELGQSYTVFVSRALEKALGDVGPVAGTPARVVQAPVPSRAPARGGLPVGGDVPKRIGCPVRTCDWRGPADEWCLKHWQQFPHSH